MTYLYTILNGDTVRIPICPVTFRYDEAEAEPLNEPPLRVPLPEYMQNQQPAVIMTCTVCQRQRKRKKVGPCKCGGWMRRR